MGNGDTSYAGTFWSSCGGVAVRPLKLEARQSKHDRAGLTVQCKPATVSHEAVTMVPIASIHYCGLSGCVY